MKAIFVSGTDTGVGKTIITGLIARYILEKGFSVITQKWIETGSPQNISRDIQLHLKIMQKNKQVLRDYLSYINPYRFKPACSAHLACQLEGKRISVGKIKQSFKFLSSQFDFVIVEGIGGVLAPFNKNKLLIDIVKALALPVLVVARNKLGAINHTLLTIEALKSRGLKLIGIVFNNLEQEKKYILDDNPDIVKRLSRESILGVLPRDNTYNKLYKSFIPIGNRIWKKIGLRKT